MNKSTCINSEEENDSVDLLRDQIEKEISLEVIYPRILNQIEEKKWDLNDLEVDISNINIVIEKSWIATECWECLISCVIDKYKILVEELLNQIKIKQNKIEVLKTQIQTLNGEKDDLKDKAFKDSLTWLYNRYYVEKIITANIKRISEWNNYNFCVWLIDLDFFKKINDEYSHLAWDLVLQNFANFMLESIKELEKSKEKLNKRNRKRNIIFRYWWEEFLVVSSLSKENLKIFLDNCLLDFSKIVHKFEWKEFSVSFSAWISEYVWWKQYDDPEYWLVKNADKALYKAKDMWRKMVLINQEID